MSEPSSRDQRKHPRHSVVIPLRYRILSSPDGTAPEDEFHNSHNLIVDLSRGGFFLSTKNCLEPDSLLMVEFPLETQRAVFSSKAKVVRSNNCNYPVHGRYEYGLQFQEVDETSRRALEAFVDSLKA